MTSEEKKLTSFDEKISAVFDIFERTGQSLFAFYIRLLDVMKNEVKRRYLIITIGTIDVDLSRATKFRFRIDQKDDDFVSSFIYSDWEYEYQQKENRSKEITLDHFFQLVIPRMKSIEAFCRPEKVSFVFLFTLKSLIKKFPLYLNKKTNAMIDGLHFYGGMKYRIVLPFGWYSISFWKYIRSQKNINPPPQKRNRAIVFYHREDLYDWYEDSKEKFWVLTNPHNIISTFPVINLNFGFDFAPDQYLFNSVSILWNFKILITHGLSGNDSRIVLNRSRTPWHEFLTKGLYDPRLLILIEEFLRPKNEKIYRWVRSVERERWYAYPFNERFEEPKTRPSS